MVRLAVLVALLGGACSSQARAGEPDCSPGRVQAIESELDSIFFKQGSFARVAQLVGAFEACVGQLEEYTTASRLGNLYQWAGTAAYAEGQLEQAACYFRRATTLAAPLPYNDDLGQCPRRLYQRASPDSVEAGWGEVVANGPVVIDGTSLVSGRTLPVPAGTHLVQYALPPPPGTQAGSKAVPLVRSELVWVDPENSTFIGLPDPKAALAQRRLRLWGRYGSMGGALAFSGLSVGLFLRARGAAGALEELDVERFGDDALGRARKQQLRANSAFVGGVVSAALAVGVGVVGFTIPAPAKAAAPAGAPAPQAPFRDCGVQVPLPEPAQGCD